ncbi:MAG: Flp pilus assembly complex ATPase component TadA [Actinomycetota bacterium]|nr:Flp pilus assembly complex ATPase component TadA [Actinomycetota bacterium]
MEIAIRHDALATLDAPQRRLALRKVLAASVPEPDLGAAVARLADEIDQYGPVTGLMADPEITDVLINGVEEVWVERAGTLSRTAVAFDDDEHLRSFMNRLLLRCGGRADRLAPVCDGSLPDGTRLHVVVSPVSDGPKISLRKFPREALTLEQLHELKMMSSSQLDRLHAAVLERRNVCISGSTGSGKTTLLNALLRLVPATERVVVVEQARELRPACAHAVCLATADANHEGVGGVELDELVRAALRMRPDRLVVGEIRGAEALPAIDALSTGHAGSMVTVHAGSADQALVRIADLAAAAARSPTEVFRTRVESSVDFIVHLDRNAGLRAVSDIVAR